MIIRTPSASSGSGYQRFRVVDEKGAHFGLVHVFNSGAQATTATLEIGDADGDFVLAEVDVVKEPGEAGIISITCHYHRPREAEEGEEPQLDLVFLYYQLIMAVFMSRPPEVLLKGANEFDLNCAFIPDQKPEDAAAAKKLFIMGVLGMPAPKDFRPSPEGVARTWLNTARKHHSLEAEVLQALLKDLGVAAVVSGGSSSGCTTPAPAVITTWAVPCGMTVMAAKVF
jgi:hypothetical protein